jgi:hypothetical protein
LQKDRDREKERRKMNKTEFCLFIDGRLTATTCRRKYCPAQLENAAGFANPALLVDEIAPTFHSDEMH